MSNGKSYRRIYISSADIEQLRNESTYQKWNEVLDKLNGKALEMESWGWSHMELGKAAKALGSAVDSCPHQKKRLTLLVLDSSNNQNCQDRCLRDKPFRSELGHSCWYQDGDFDADFCKTWLQVAAAPITQHHIEVFDAIKTKDVSDLNAELKELQHQFKAAPSFELLRQIRQLIAKIKALAHKFLLNALSHIKSIKRKLTVVLRRNIRLFYRSIITILFKNMDDESHSEFVVQPVTNNFIHFQRHHHAKERASYYKTE